MRLIIRLAVLLLLALAVRARSQHAKLNVVLFVVDDVADSDIDAIRTPALDSMASQGVRFLRAYSNPWCSPSRDSLMFSSWDGRFRGKDCETGSPQLRPADAFTLGKLFQQSGYTTAYFGKWHLGAMPKNDWRVAQSMRGFDRTICANPVGRCETPGGKKGKVLALPRLDDGELSWAKQQNTIALRNSLKAWWQETEGPKFAMVSFRAAHAPFIRPPAEILYDWVDTTPTENPRALFEEEVISVDFVLGELMPTFAEDTVVIYLGDNGTPGEVPPTPQPKPSRPKFRLQSPQLTLVDATREDQDPKKVKLSCYEDGVRIPMIITSPSFRSEQRGTQSDALVHLVDLLPSLAEMLQLPFEAKVDGRSFVPALSGGPSAHDWVYVQHSLHKTRAIISDRYKLLMDMQGEFMFYDLKLDPKEVNPLGIDSKEAKALRVTMRQVRARFL